MTQTGIDFTPVRNSLKENLERILKSDTAPLDEYSLNLRAMMETIGKVQDKNGNLIPFRMLPTQAHYFKNRTSKDIILKARQMGMTTGIQMEFAVEAMLTPGMEVIYVAQRDDSAKRLFEITTRIYHALPPELRLPNISDSTHKLTFDFGGGKTSTIEIGTAGSKSFGRGRPVHRALFTEVAFYEGQELNTMAGIIAAMPGPEAEIPGRYVMESTANGQGGTFAETFWAAWNDKTDITAFFYPWWWDPGYKIRGGRLTHLEEEEKYLVEQHGLTHDQIRWRRWQLGNFLGRVRGYDFFQQEFPEAPEKAFMSVGDAVFDSEAIDRASKVTDPIKVALNGAVRYWETRTPGRKYIVSVDQASGGQVDAANKPTDYQVATVWEATSLAQCAVIRGRIGQTQFAEMIGKLSQYYNDALVVVERNQAQFGFIDLLYNAGVTNMYIHLDRKPGWPNSAGSKPIAITNFEEICNAHGMVIRNSNLVAEARNYRWLRKRGTGSTGAGPGGNDDELMTAMMAALPTVRDQAMISRAVAVQPGVQQEMVKIW